MSQVTGRRYVFLKTDPRQRWKALDSTLNRLDMLTVIILTKDDADSRLQLRARTPRSLTKLLASEQPTAPAKF